MKQLARYPYYSRRYINEVSSQHLSFSLPRLIVLDSRPLFADLRIRNPLIEVVVDLFNSLARPDATPSPVLHLDLGFSLHPLQEYHAPLHEELWAAVPPFHRMYFGHGCQRWLREVSPENLRRLLGDIMTPKSQRGNREFRSPALIGVVHTSLEYRKPHEMYNYRHARGFALRATLASNWGRGGAAPDGGHPYRASQTEESRDR